MNIIKGKEKIKNDMLNCVNVFQEKLQALNVHNETFNTEYEYETDKLFTTIKETNRRMKLIQKLEITITDKLNKIIEEDDNKAEKPKKEKKRRKKKLKKRKIKSEDLNATLEEDYLDCLEEDQPTEEDLKFIDDTKLSPFLDEEDDDEEEAINTTYPKSDEEAKKIIKNKKRKREENKEAETKVKKRRISNDFINFEELDGLLGIHYLHRKDGWTLEYKRALMKFVSQYDYFPIETQEFVKFIDDIKKTYPSFEFDHPKQCRKQAVDIIDRYKRIKEQDAKRTNNKFTS